MPFIYQIIFVANFLLMVLLMKLISWKITPLALRPPLAGFLFGTPLLSARSARLIFHRKIPLSLLVTKLTLSFIFLILLIATAKIFVPLGLGHLILFSPIIYFLTESMGALAQILFYAGPPIRPIHRHPLTSHSLGDFWGKHWNIWVQDWLKDISRKWQKKIKGKLFISFLASGLFHELMVNLPYALTYGKCYFGNMTLYFAIQGLGLWIDKRWLTHTSKTIRRVYLWIVVLGASPLFLSPPLLKFFGIINE